MKRVQYEKNPVYEVILQLKFPPILVINSKDPVDFQEKIRTDFPIYQLQISNQQELTLSPVGNNTIPSIKQKRQIKNHIFIDREGVTKIVLSQESISISTRKYTRWENLIDKFKPVLSAFVDIYSPSFYSRIGLRYTDIYSKEELDLESSAWKDLINAPYSGVFTISSEEKVINNTSDFSWFLSDDKSCARVRVGLAKTKPDENNKFVIDSDFSQTGTIEIDDFSKIAAYLHNEEGKFNSEAISDKLKEAMNPKDIGEYE